MLSGFWMIQYCGVNRNVFRKSREIFVNILQICILQKKDPGLYHMDTNIFVFSAHHGATLELFNNTFIKKHARVASIERLWSQPETLDLGFYGYNFFDGKGDSVILNTVWHLGDTLDDIDSLFTDFTSFRHQHLESSKLTSSPTRLTCV